MTHPPSGPSTPPPPPGPRDSGSAGAAHRPPTGPANVPHLVRTGRRLLRPGELAALAGITPQQVWRLAETGRIHAAAVTPGGHARYRWPDVADALGQEAA